MAEWSKAAVLKTVEPKGSQGSNPCLSAKKLKGSFGSLLLYKLEVVTGILNTNSVEQAYYKIIRHTSLNLFLG